VISTLPAGSADDFAGWVVAGAVVVPWQPCVWVLQPRVVVQVVEQVLLHVLEQVLDDWPGATNPVIPKSAFGGSTLSKVWSGNPRPATFLSYRDSYGFVDGVVDAPEPDTATAAIEDMTQAAQTPISGFTMGSSSLNVETQ